MQKVKRPLLQAGLIISVIAYSILFLDTMASSVIANEFGVYSLVVIIYVLMFLAIIGIVFSSIGLGVCGKPYELYKNKRGFILTVFIILCILTFLLIVGMIVGEMMINGFILMELILMILGAVFTMIGFAKGKQNTVYEFADRNQSAFEDAYNKIEKLQKLRELNIISEGEFEILKRKQIEQLNK